MIWHLVGSWGFVEPGSTRLCPSIENQDLVVQRHSAVAATYLDLATPYGSEAILKELS